MTEGKVYELPYRLAIPGNLQVGHRISLKGKLHFQIDPDGIAISIALLKSLDKTMAFYIAVRLTQDKGAWLVGFNDDMELSTRIPVSLKLGDTYLINITCEEDELVVELSGAKEPLKLNYVTPLRQIGFAFMDGAFDINEVSLRADVV